jgi:hypothetical protein
MGTPIQNVSPSADRRAARIESVKSWLDLAKSVILIGLVALFFVYPAALWSALDRAGLSLDEVEFFGAKLRKSAAATATLASGLEDAGLINQKLQSELGTARESLARTQGCFASLDALRACANDTALKAQIERLTNDIGATQQVARSSAESITRTLDTNSAIIEESAARVTPTGTNWLVVFGGDVSRRAAEDEIRKAMPAQNLAIYLRQRSFRSVAEFSSRQEAERALPRLKGINAGAYLVAAERWCSQREERARTDTYTFFECTALRG